MKDSIKSPKQTRTKPAFSIYKTTQGSPYTAEYFDIPYSELTPELDIEDLKMMTDSITATYEAAGGATVFLNTNTKFMGP